mmetsp:Transcript_42443/g.76109  ORF Transcript_42443/g.76109 Transcript_42443/m.76109 type:complete len:89 (+) Transcript_42443:1-267(+)
MRAFALSSIACVQVIGNSNNNAACVQSCAGVAAGAFAITARSMNIGPACSTALELWDPEAWQIAVRENARPPELDLPPEDGNIIIPEE